MIGAVLGGGGAMEPVRFEGTYLDAIGSEPVSWQIRSSVRPGWDGRYEISTTIRGVEVWGSDFDGLEPVDRDAATSAGLLNLTAWGDVGNCILTGHLPCTAEISGQPVPIAVYFELDLYELAERPVSRPPNLTLSTTVDDTEHVVVDDWFEDGLLRLSAALRPARLRCCVTCLYSDYSPAGHGLMGMRCHRDAKEAYLRVRSKTDYWPIPVTEEVPETYLCEQYRPRIPGTGYRG
jgi:Family of unknown function (DUF6304)